MFEKELKALALLERIWTEEIQNGGTELTPDDLRVLRRDRELFEKRIEELEEYANSIREAYDLWKFA